MAKRLGWAAVSLGLAIAPMTAQAGACEELGPRLHLANTEITLAQAFEGGAFAAPDGVTYADLPPFCRIVGVSHPTEQSNIGFEVWMPTDDWNQKFQGVGNGGLAGAVLYAPLALALQQGYAAAGTDDGHVGSSPLWLSNRELVIDFGTRAVHTTAQVAKRIIAAFYGERPTASYFVGCSEGGREALMEAQRFPDDYDGIIAGDPFNDASRTVTGQLFLSDVLLGTPDGAFDLASLQTLHDAVLAECDAKDGVADGVLTDPRQCRFDPRKLLCTGGTTTGCLTQGQVDSALKYYAGARDPVTGEQIFPGQVRGSEVLTSPIGWYIFQLGIPLSSFSLTILPYAVFHDPAWDYTTFDYHRDTARVDRTLGPVWNAIDSDLDAFRSRGGKLIMFHGFADWLITPLVSTEYYGRVARETTAPQSFIRLFMAPGVGHCNGGPGPNAFGISGQPPVPYDPQHSLIAALDRWVTRGKPPSRIIATKFVKDDPSQGVAVTRPLCPYPRVAIYSGEGDTNSAANFRCGAESDEAD